MVGANYIVKLKLYEKRPFNAKDKHAELYGDPEVSEGGGVIPTMPGDSVRGRGPLLRGVHSQSTDSLLTGESMRSVRWRETRFPCDSVDLAPVVRCWGAGIIDDTENSTRISFAKEMQTWPTPEAQRAPCSLDPGSQGAGVNVPYMGWRPGPKALFCFTNLVFATSAFLVSRLHCLTVWTTLDQLFTEELLGARHWSSSRHRRVVGGLQFMPATCFTHVIPCYCCSSVSSFPILLIPISWTFFFFPLTSNHGLSIS